MLPPVSLILALFWPESVPLINLSTITFPLGESKQSLHGPGQARGFQEVEVARFHSRHMKVVMLSAPSTGHFNPPRKYSWHSFLLEAESSQVPLCGRKDYVTEKLEWWIEPATFRLAAQCLNQVPYRVPHTFLLLTECSGTTVVTNVTASK